MAEALTRKYEQELEVESAGTSPAGKIAENARRMLEGESASKYLKPSPDPVSERALEEADSTIVMSKDHVKYLSENFKVERENIENWDIEDPIDPDVTPDETFEKIKSKVLKMD